MKVIYNVLGI